MELAHGGDGDRVEVALDDALSEEDVAAIDAKLARMDGEAPWTRQTLRLIAAHPRVAASKLKRETLPFKVDVRKLKMLGLTQSFEVGYELSPRGKGLLALKPRATKARATKTTKTTKTTRPKRAKVKTRKDPIAR